MAIKQVQSFQTSDEKLHPDKVTALTHQLMIDCRGVMQSNDLGKRTTISVTDVAQFISNHSTELYELLKKYKGHVATIHGAQKNRKEFVK